MAFAITSVMRGYHAYKDIWEAAIDSELPCLPEPDNREDRYAVAIMKSADVVGHVPRRVSYICNIFIRILLFQWNILRCTDESLLDFHKTTRILLSVLAVPQ